MNEKEKRLKQIEKDTILSIHASQDLLSLTDKELKELKNTFIWNIKHFKIKRPKQIIQKIKNVKTPFQMKNLYSHYIDFFDKLSKLADQNIPKQDKYYAEHFFNKYIFGDE